MYLVSAFTDDWNFCERVDDLSFETFKRLVGIFGYAIANKDEAEGYHRNLVTVLKLKNRVKVQYDGVTIEVEKCS